MIEDPMSAQKAIFVPGYGVPEAIRSIRFLPRLDSPGQFDRTRTSPPQTPMSLEVWQGDLYGEPTKEMLTTFSTSDRTETVYADGEMPLVLPGKSAVAVVHDTPSGWEVEFQSEFIDREGNAMSRTVILDNHGTARESHCELRSLARLRSISRDRSSDMRRTSHVARSLGRFVGRLTTSISRVFKVAPSATNLAAQHAIPVDHASLNRPAVRTRRFAPESSDDSGA